MITSDESLTSTPALPNPESQSPGPNNPPWGVWTAILVWIGSVLALWVVPQLCAVPYLISHYRGIEPTRELLLADKTFILILVIAFVPTHLITLLVAWAVATRLGRYKASRVFGWSWHPQYGLVIDLLLTICLSIVLFGVAWALTNLFGGQDTELERILRSSRAAALVVAFVAAFTAPLVEEVIYRGLLYSALHRAVGSIAAVVIVSSLFAGLHVVQYWPNFGAIAAITFLSIALTTVRSWTGRLLPCFIIHTLFNGIQSVIIVFEPYLRAWAERMNTRGTIQFFISFLT